MAYTGHFSTSLRGKIYTLAQSGTQVMDFYPADAIVLGEGTNIINNPSLENRAKRKAISRKMILSLIDVAKEKGDLVRTKHYWNAYHCLSKVIISNNKMYGKYCKNRFCTICSAIRKADLINKYYSTMIKWNDVHFVTLTVKSCKAHALNKYINGMFRAFTLIHNRCKKRHQRGKGIKLIGVKSLECNFNPIAKTYNPHFHLIVANKEIAELLKNEWLFQWKSNKTLYTYHIAQHIRPIRDLKHDLIEIIKYGSKIFTEPDLKKKSIKANNIKIYAYALDNIFTAMKGKRIFDRFGFDLPQQLIKKAKIKRIADFEEWEFPAKTNDWINPETGECLTGYIQSPELCYLLDECIDTSLH